MSYYKGNKIIIILMATLCLGSAESIFPQEKKAGGGEKSELKKLLVEKFDANLDKNLSQAEQLKAVAFLETADENGDGEISAVERDAAVTRLRKMTDLAQVKGTKKQTLANRNIPKRAAKWQKFMKSMPHGAGPKIFTGKLMPGDKGFDPNGEKLVDITLKRDVPEFTRKEITPEELDKILSQRRKKNANYKKKFSETNRKPTAKESKSLKKASNFYANRIILAYEGVHTTVPHGAVLNVPVKLQSMVVEKPVGKMVMWPYFLKKYTKVLDTKEVTWATVKGEDPITEKEKKRIEAGNKIVVAVYKGGPVTVLDPPAKDEEADDGEPAVLSSSDNKKKRK